MTYNLLVWCWSKVMAYTDQKVSPTNINYTSKDFSSLKADLIQYTKAYFPDTYKDFNETSPGMMLIELASYVGDVLSYYIDYNYKESLLTTATERKNVIRLAEFLGYKTTPITPSIVKLTVTQEVDAVGGLPDYGSIPTTARTIDSGLQVSSTEDSSLIFETLGEIDFTISGSPDTPAPEIIGRDDTGIANRYRLTRHVNAVSGETKTKSFTITNPTKFLELDLGETNVVEILNVVDSSQAKYFEVDYLAQDRILKEIHYSNDPNRVTGYSDPTQPLSGGNQMSVDVSIPYTLEYIKTNKKFVRKVDPVTNNTKLQFGNGLYRFNISGSSSAGLFSTIEQQGMSVSGVPSTVINSAINNLTTNNSLNLGETPANTIITVTYRVGGGANSNAQAGELTNLVSSVSGISVTNTEPASGGTDGETITEIKENAKTFFASQLRCVTREDYQARILNLPAKFGNIAKAQVVRLNDISGLKIYTLSYDQRRKLTQTPLLVLNNLRLYLEQFRMINDALDFGFDLNTVDPSDAEYDNTKIFSGYKINFGVFFEAVADRRFNKTEVKLDVISCIRDFFVIDKMQFGQAINLNELRYEILGKEGVIGLPTLKIFQSTANLGNEFSGTERVLCSFDAEGISQGTETGYGFKYSFEGALQNDIIRPSVTPAVFELREPNNDIYGRVI